MSVIVTDEYRQAFSLHVLRARLTTTQLAVLEQARREARLPEGRYPLPCGVESTPHRGGDEVAVARMDGPTEDRRPRPARYSRWADEER